MPYMKTILVGAWVCIPCHVVEVLTACQIGSLALGKTLWFSGALESRCRDVSTIRPSSLRNN